MDGPQEPPRGVADVDLGVLAAGGPDQGPAQRVVLDPQCELAVVILDLPHHGARVKVNGEQIPVVSLEGWKGQGKAIFIPFEVM